MASAPFFTPVQTALGGVLLHLSTSNLLRDVGTVFGVSGIVYGSVFGDRAKWRWAILGGMVTTAAALQAEPLRYLVTGSPIAAWERLGGVLGRVATAGFLVGLGSKLGSGCTSGHFLCGASRLSKRSIIATLVFFPTAVLTAYLFPLDLALTPLSRPAYIPKTSPDQLLLAIPIGISVIAHSLVLPVSRSAPEGSIRRVLPHALSGAVFSLGLIVSGMADPTKVLGFLQVSDLSKWDPSLAMVFLLGVVPNAVDYASYMRQPRDKADTPKLRLPWAKWNVPTRSDVDWKLVGGALIFGVGWGLAGVCPGPAVVGAAATVARAVGQRAVDSSVMASATFIGTMLLGMFSGGLL